MTFTLHLVLCFAVLYFFTVKLIKLKQRADDSKEITELKCKLSMFEQVLAEQLPSEYDRLSSFWYAIEHPEDNWLMKVKSGIVHKNASIGHKDE